MGVGYFVSGFSTLGRNNNRGIELTVSDVVPEKAQLRSWDTGFASGTAVNHFLTKSSAPSC